VSEHWCPESSCMLKGGVFTLAKMHCTIKIKERTWHVRAHVRTQHIKPLTPRSLEPHNDALHIQNQRTHLSCARAAPPASGPAALWSPPAAWTYPHRQRLPHSRPHHPQNHLRFHLLLLLPCFSVVAGVPFRSVSVRR